MQLIEQYAGKLIDKVFAHFGKDAVRYETATLHPGMGKGSFTGYPTEKARLDYHLAYLETESLKLTFLAAAAQYLHPEFYHMLKKLTGQAVTQHLGLLLAGEEESWTYPEKIGGFHLLREYLKVEKRAENFLYTELYADERLMFYLLGYDEPVEKIRGFTNLYFPEDEPEPLTLPETDALYERMQAAKESGTSYLFQISGEKGSGKKTLLKSLAGKTGHGWVFVDFSQMENMNGKEFGEAFWLTLREAALYGFGLCFFGFSTKKPEAYRHFLENWKKTKQQFFYPVCLCTESEEELIPVSDCPVYSFSLSSCTIPRRIAVWKKMAADRMLTLDAEKYGSRYKLNPGDIRKITEGMFVSGGNHLSEDERDLLVAELVQKTKKSPENGSLKPVASRYLLSDLKLEAKQMETLENISAYVRQSYKVYHLWNMEKHFAYGRAVTALFCGPPGTGKSMAARALSNELKMPLYRIDLSQVVDKYIGETEKKLEEIFSYAQNSNVILFFDEADSIFGKRTDVKESKDKYANTEVSYLLQRIEEYDGVVILATNLKNNIDEAFMRRMKYVVDFQIPDEKTRKEIWIDGLSGDVVLDNVDFDYLAQKVELSGGYIKNIILNALFLAAKEGDCVNMKHLLQSTCNEYQKLGKMMTSRDFEKYAFYLMN